MKESDLNDMKDYIDKLKKILPYAEIEKLHAATTKFFEKIEQKPDSIKSKNVMGKVLEAFPNMPANQIDDFLLKHGIGSEDALDDFLKLKKLQKANKTDTNTKEKKAHDI